MFFFFLFFFNDTATTEIYTLSLHDALPIYVLLCAFAPLRERFPAKAPRRKDKTKKQRTATSRGSLGPHADRRMGFRSEEHTSELQSQSNLVCRLLLEKKKKKKQINILKKKK